MGNVREKPPNLPVQSWNALRIPRMGWLSHPWSLGMCWGLEGLEGVGIGPGSLSRRKDVDEPASVSPSS